MLTALSTGHDGSLCTVHAGSPAEALRRVEVLALMSDVGLPHAAIREQVADAFDLVVCQARVRRRLAARGLGRRGRAGRRGPGGAGAVHVARRRAALARATRLEARVVGRTALGGRSRARPRGAAKPGAVVSYTPHRGVSDHSGRVMAGRARVRGGGRRGRRASGNCSPPSSARAWRPSLAASWRRSCGPGARACRRRSPSGGGSRSSRPPRWPRPAGCSAGRRSRCSRASPGRSARDAAACAPGGGASARRWRPRRRSSRARSPTRCRPGTPCAARSTSSPPASPAPRATSSAPPRGRCGSARRPRPCSNACAAAPPRPRGTRWSPASCSSATRAATCPALLRDLALGARGRGAPGPRRDRRHRPGALHRPDRARAADRRRAARRARPARPARRPLHQPDLGLADLLRPDAAGRSRCVAVRRLAAERGPMSTAPRRRCAGDRARRRGPRRPRRATPQAAPRRTRARGSSPASAPRSGSTPPAASRPGSPPPGLDRPTSEIVALQAGLALLTTLAALPTATLAPGRLGVALLLAAPVAGFLAPEYALRRRARTRARRDGGRAARRARPAPGRDRRGPRAATGARRRSGGATPACWPRSSSAPPPGRRWGSRPTDAHAPRAALSRRPGSPPLVAALKRAERHGAPLATTLAAQAAEARSRRAAQRSEQAAKAAPKIQLVVALLLVPAVLLLVAAALIPALTTR